RWEIPPSWKGRMHRTRPRPGRYLSLTFSDNISVNISGTGGFRLSKAFFLYLCACNEKICRRYIAASASKELHLLLAGRVCGRSQDRLSCSSPLRTEKILYGHRPQCPLLCSVGI